MFNGIVIHYFIKANIINECHEMSMNIMKIVLTFHRKAKGTFPTNWAIDHGLSAETMQTLDEWNMTSPYKVAHLTDAQVKRMNLTDAQTANLIRAARHTAFDLGIPWYATSTIQSICIQNIYLSNYLLFNLFTIQSIYYSIFLRLNLFTIKSICYSMYMD